MAPDTWRMVALNLFAIDAVLSAVGSNPTRGVLLPLGLAFFAASFIGALT